MTKRFIFPTFCALLLICSGIFTYNFSYADDPKPKADNSEGSKEDTYRLDVAYKIQKNWKFYSDDTESDLNTSIVFKVMPDGEIKNVVFIKKSGNKVLDASAYNAIVTTSPVKPFPESITKEYLQMGLNFTPNATGR